MTPDEHSHRDAPDANAQGASTPTGRGELWVGDAVAGDMSMITALYNAEIDDGVALWNTRRRTVEEMARWAAERAAGGYAVLSGRLDGRWAGFGATGPFRPHDGYAGVVEHSLYVAAAARRRGLGRALLAALIARAEAAGAHAMIGGLEAANHGSRRLHADAGFVEVGRLPDIGRKFQRPLTLVLMQKTLAGAAR